MSYTKRYIEDLQSQGMDPMDVSDEQYDAEYMEFLRNQELERMAEEWLEEHPDEIEKMNTVFRGDAEILPVTKTEVETKEKVN